MNEDTKSKKKKRCSALTEEQNRIFEESLRENHDLMVALSKM